ncbi:Arabinosidase B [Pholiota conissans]|uniref:Alpha-L-arabinofuranosidase n=1 Tax=Pholiota conissans TaxID=109636 RepID=A0A9P5Z3C6_9AGAR|nr:Arabinosidase B [Pholiota conissans]
MRADVLALGLAATVSLVAAGPCDIYASGGTPCVAAHSTTRALFSAFSGSLYQVRRGSDSATLNIGPLSAGGVANAASQDSFCTGTTCLITTIFDQTGRGNHLTQAPPGGFSGPAANGFDNLASATGAPVTLNGQKAYGVFISPGTGYRNNAASGTAKGDAPQGMYAVLDGTHFNGGCCFDFGNAETSSRDTGNGHMEAIYFGTESTWGTGSGSGPWIMADLENGLFSGANPKQNTADQSISSRFVTAVVKGEPNQWSIRGGNAASGALSTFYSGVRPSVSGYNPMSKEGAIILGIGGDNSNGAQGTFYEGVMTSGYPSDATENSVQANIVAAKYATTSLTSGTAAFTVGSSISLRATTACCTTRFIAHTGATVNTQVVSLSSATALKQQASWIMRTGLCTLGGIKYFRFDCLSMLGMYIGCPMPKMSENGDSYRFREHGKVVYISRESKLNIFGRRG